MKLPVITLFILWALSVYCVESMRAVEYVEMLPTNTICYNNKAFKPVKHKKKGDMLIKIKSQKTGLQLDCDRPRISEGNA